MSAAWGRAGTTSTFVQTLLNSRFDAPTTVSPLDLTSGSAVPVQPRTREPRCQHLHRYYYCYCTCTYQYQNCFGCEHVVS